MVRVDGFVAGTWSVEGTAVRIAPFVTIEDESAVRAEADRLARWIKVDAS